MAEYETRIDVLSCPTTVYVGEAFQVVGKLVYVTYYGEFPLPWTNVEVYVDGAKVGERTTNQDGSFTITLTISTAGTHTVRIYFPGKTEYAPILPPE
jgi:phosphatidate phosphatase APP1